MPRPESGRCCLMCAKLIRRQYPQFHFAPELHCCLSREILFIYSLQEAVGGPKSGPGIQAIPRLAQADSPLPARKSGIEKLRFSPTLRADGAPLVGPVDPSFRALSGRLKFKIRRHKFNKDFPVRRKWVVDGGGGGPGGTFLRSLFFLNRKSGLTCAIFSFI